MKEVFGIPVDTLLVALLIALGAAAGILVVLGLRNRVLVKLAVRSVRRRRARSALIVLGLMLGTTIIAAALTTGDTMSHTIRATAVDALGATDETIAPKGAVDDIPGALGAAAGMGWIDEDVVERVEQAVAGSGLVDGVTGAVVEPVAVLAPAQRQNEPSVVLADDTLVHELNRTYRATDFMEAVKVEFYADEVFVFTPKGEVKSLAAGATPLDFAYEVHTDVGHRCVGAKVNGRIVPLRYQIVNGDIVEILTQNGHVPSRDWLKFVKTSRAKTRIKS